MHRLLKLPFTLLTNVKLRQLNVALQDALIAERERHQVLKGQHQALIGEYTATVHRCADLQAHIDSMNASMYGGARG